MISQNWEHGLPCAACGNEIAVGAQMLYGKHIECASGSRNGPDDPVEAAEAALAAGGRVAIPKAQLRALAVLACQQTGQLPVRRPDRGRTGVRWYARTAGWTADRVAAGLDVPHIAGLWLDVLDGGRTPPVSHPHLQALIEAARAKVA